MRRGRVIFWSVSSAVILAGAGFVLWLQLVHLKHPGKLAPDPIIERLNREGRAKHDLPPQPWAPAVAWWKANTIDAYDRVTQGKQWPSARRAVVAFGRDLSGDPPRTGDEPEDALAAAATARDYNCDDPLVLFIHGRYQVSLREEDAAGNNGPRELIEAGDRFRAAADYPVYLRCLAVFRAARAVATTPQYKIKVPAEKAKEYADAAAALFPGVAADTQLPLFAALQLVEEVGSLARATRRDRMEMVNPLLAALEKAGRPRSHVLALRGDALTSYAWDARGSGFAGTVTQAGWKGFAERLKDARAALTEAWEADNTNTHAAAQMITVCMGEGADFDEMDRWFKRALDANPGNYNACSRKMLFLEPKWGGSPAHMISFGRELAALTDPRAVRLRTMLPEAHWTLATYIGGRSPAPAYFAQFPEVWDDVHRAYDLYLKSVPEARYHRTRYAVMAAWAGKWDVAAAQFDQLGEQYSREVVSEGVVKALREQAKQKSKGGPATGPGSESNAGPPSSPSPQDPAERF